MNCNATVIVDTSYVVFAKWYSALGWYRASINRNPDIAGVMESAVFQSKFLSMFESGIYRIKHRFGMENADVVFAKDCSRYSVWRRTHFAEYKEGRSHNCNFNSDIFNYVYTVAIPAYLQRSPGGMIGVDRAEADDVIGVLCRHISASRPGHRVVVISNDNDCIQLASPNVTVVNLLMQDVGGRRGSLTPRQYLISRILSGDRSDNIPSVISRCGPKTAAKLVTEHDETALRDMYDPVVYGRNDLLMDLNNIPADISAAIVNAYEVYRLQHGGDGCDGCDGDRSVDGCPDDIVAVDLERYDADDAYGSRDPSQ